MDISASTENTSHGFFSKTYDVTRKSWDIMARSNPTSVRILALMCENMDSNNYYIQSIEDIVDELASSRSVIARALRYLNENKIIRTYRTGQSNIYRVSPQYFFRAKEEYRMAAIEDFLSNDMPEYKNIRAVVRISRKANIDKKTGEVIF